MTRRLPFQGVGEGASPFPGLLLFTFDPNLILLSIKQESIKYHFFVIGLTRPGIEPMSFRPFMNILLIRPMAQLGTKEFFGNG